MFPLNNHPEYRQPLDPADAETLGVAAANKVERFLSFRENHAETPLVALPRLAAEIGVSAIHVKDEAYRLGLGSFKALGGAYAVIRLLLEEAGESLGRAVDVSELYSAEVRPVACSMTFACATDGNHGRSVAQGAQLVGAKAAIFVHAGVSKERVAAIARFGAEIIGVDGSYDDSVRESSRVAEANGWTVVSDTSWPGYERIPGLVMQGYVALVPRILATIAGTADACVHSVGRWRNCRGCGWASGGRAWRQASDLHGGRSCPRSLHRRDGARGTSGDYCPWRTDRHGDARMQHPLAAGLAHSRARCRCLHDGGRRRRNFGHAAARRSGGG